MRETNPLRSDPCSHCGGMHDSTGCRFKNAECHYCHKRGHIAAICRQKPKRQSTPQRRSTYVVEVEGTDTPAEYTELLNNVHTPNSKPLLATLQIQGAPVEMEIDTGATLSVMAYDTYSSTWNGDQAPPIKPTTANLCTYTGKAIKVVGAIDVDVEYEGQQAKLNLVIVDGKGQPLLGRDWLHHIRLDWGQFHKVDVEQSTQLKQILSKHATLFKPGLSKIAGMKAKFYLKKDAKPKFCRARQVPFAIRAKVEKEIDRLVADGVMEPVKYLEWATPVVPVMKTGQFSCAVIIRSRSTRPQRRTPTPYLVSRRC